MSGASQLLESQAESYELGTAGTTIRLDLTGRTATLLVGDDAGSGTEIEISPTGPLPGDYFVGTFDGPSPIGLARLGEDYDNVREIDFVQMVQGERDVSGFPRIAAVGPEEARRLEIVGGGAPTRVDLHPVAEAAWAA